MNGLKFIQINIYKGKYLDSLIDFLIQEDPDFVSIQEVTVGIVNNCDRSVDVYREVKDKTGLGGVFFSDLKIVEDSQAKHGNAVLAKWPIEKSSHVFLNKWDRKMSIAEFNDSGTFPNFPRSLVDTQVNVSGQLVHVLSIHGAWTAPPRDTAETLRQAELIAAHLKGLNAPFILGGDLNNIPESKTVGLINNVANNLMMGSGIRQTTHPKIHKIAPKGYLVDYIFASHHFKLRSLRVPEVLVSDHLPVVAELEF